MYRYYIENFVLAAIAFLAVATSIIDAIGLVESVDFLSREDIPSITLLILGILSLYIILERHYEVRDTKEKVSTNKKEIEINREEVEKIRNEYSNIDVLSRLITKGDHFSELLLNYGVKEFGEYVSEEKIIVDKRRALDFWLDSMRGCGKWLTVTYAKPSEVWDLSEGRDMSLAVQSRVKNDNGIIKRVFVVEDNEEKKGIIENAKDQEEIGIEVKWIMKDKIPNQRRTNEARGNVGTLDFAAVDSGWVFRSHLDESREVLKVEGNKEERLVRSAETLFRDVFDEANEFNFDDTT